MEANKKVIEGLLPITTTKAVYMDGTSKTLQESIDDGTLGRTETISTTGRGHTIFKLRGARIFIEEVIESLSTVTKIKYTFLSGDVNRLRRLFVWKPNGTAISIEIPDGYLALNEGLVYNVDTNTLSTKIGTWGNISVANNEYLLLYNDYQGCVGGILSQYIITNEQVNIPIKYLDYEICSNVGNNLSQGIFICGENMYHWGHSSDDRLTLGGFRRYSMADLNTKIHEGQHNLGHMNAPSYCETRDMMIVGNGSKLYDQTSLPMQGWILKNFKSVLESNPTNIDFNTIEKVTLDLSQFKGEFKAQLCWGDSSTDYVFLLTCENRIIRKLLLNKVSGEYDGTYTVVGKWMSTQEDVMGGFKYYNGCLYTGVKGDYGVRKMKLCSNGKFTNEYLVPNNMIGTMQGIDIKNDILYAFTTDRGYKIDYVKTL